MKKIFKCQITLLFLSAGISISKGVKAQSGVGNLEKDTVRLEKSDSPKEESPLLHLGKDRSAISSYSVSGTTLFKTPAANLTNTLYGRLPGLFVVQGSGEPGYDGASLFARGQGTYDNPSIPIYVDGFQVNSSYFSYLSPAEIESISLITNPVILSTLGMKGGNNVIWVVTKRGHTGKAKTQIQLVQGSQRAINIDKPYDSYNYARLYNEAISNDNYALNGYQFVWTPKYSASQLAAYQNGTGTDVDWFDQALKKATPYSDANVSFTGGNEATKYAVVLDYMRQAGLYDVSTNDRTSNAQIQRFDIRSNFDFNFFKIFEAKIDLGGRIESRRYPNYNGPQLWQDMASYPSNIYPVKDSATGNWSGTSIYPNNPVASLNALGWSETQDRTLQANFELKEKLDFLTQGLYLKEAASFNTWTRNSSSKTATYARYFNGVQTTTDKTTTIASNGTSPTDQYDWKQAKITLGYDKEIGLNSFSGAVNYYASNYITDAGTNGSGQNEGNNIFYHYENLGGQFHYAFDSKYLLDIGLGYSGSDEYAHGNRWGFYPAASIGWIISNEKFLKGNNTLTRLKVGIAAGKSGNDQSNQGRYLYQQYYTGNGTYYTGDNSLTSNSGIIPSYGANANIFAEKSTKYTASIEAELIHKLSLRGDIFIDERRGIITYDNALMAVYGISAPYENVGSVNNRGYEVSIAYADKAGDFDYTISAAVSSAKNKILYEAEIPPVNNFSRTTGLPIGTPIGLVAQGFYDVTDFNADGSLKSGLPQPAFGAVQPGDIKYKDLDGNGIINQNDVTKIGNPVYPSLTYSFNVNLGYKGFDLTALFQGNSGSSVNLLSAAYYQTVAFVNNINVFPIAGNAWAYFPSEGIDTRATATYPRLTTEANNNNYQNSTFWMRKNDFIRLRNVELGYSFSASALKSLHIDKLRIYVSAVNPVTWSSLLKHDHLDPETFSGYPGLKSYNVGASLTF